MKERLKRDKAKTHVLPISALGLMEMTRQRAQESISGAVYEPCPYCLGRGKVKSSMTMSVELQRSLHQTLRRFPDVHELKVIVNPHVLQRLRTEDEELLVEIERKYAGRLTFRSDPTLPPREIRGAGCDDESGVEVRQKARMTNERDALRVSSFVIRHSSFVIRHSSFPTRPLPRSGSPSSKAPPAGA